MADASYKIEREEFADGRGGQYWIRLPEGEATLVYRWQADDLVSADRTFTPPAARGRGAAAALVARLVADARKEKFMIRPTCPYVALWFDRNPDADDVRAD
jgi:hypothetical protein